MFALVFVCGMSFSAPSYGSERRQNAASAECGCGGGSEGRGRAVTGTVDSVGSVDAVSSLTACNHVAAAGGGTAGAAVGTERTPGRRAADGADCTHTRGDSRGGTAGAPAVGVGAVVIDVAYKVPLCRDVCVRVATDVFKFVSFARSQTPW